MKKAHRFLSLSGAVSFIAPALALAQESAGPATFAGSYTLWIAIIIGFVAGIWTFYYGVGMANSTVGQILKLFGAGMFVVVLGFLAVVVAWAPAGTQKIVHDLLFILGYILMLLGVAKVKKLGV